MVTWQCAVGCGSCSVVDVVEVRCNVPGVCVGTGAGVGGDPTGGGLEFLKGAGEYGKGGPAGGMDVEVLVNSSSLGVGVAKQNTYGTEREVIGFPSFSPWFAWERCSFGSVVPNVGNNGAVIMVIGINVDYLLCDFLEAGLLRDHPTQHHYPVGENIRLWVSIWTKARCYKG